MSHEADHVLNHWDVDSRRWVVARTGNSVRLPYVSYCESRMFSKVDSLLCFGIVVLVRREDDTVNHEDPRYPLQMESVENFRRFLLSGLSDPT